jgi:LppP/LprE lipoprotein
LVQLAALQLSVGIVPRSIANEDRGEYQVRVSNPSASPVTVALAVADAEGPLTYELDPAELKVGARDEQVAKLVVRPKEKPKRGDKKESSFAVAATPGPQDDVFPNSGEATFVAQGGVGCILALPFGLSGVLGTLLGYVGLRGFWRQIAVIPAVIMATLLAFVVTGGKVPLSCPPIPTPWGSSIQLCGGNTFQTGSVPGLPALPFGLSPPAVATPTPATSRPATPGSATTNGASPGGAPATPANDTSPAASPTSSGNPTGSAGTPASRNGASSPGTAATPGTSTTSSGAPSPTSSGVSVSFTPTIAGGGTTSVGVLPDALATVTAHNFQIADTKTYTSTYGTGPLHVVIGTAAGGDGHSQLAYIFYNDKYLGTDTLQPSGQIAFAGWRDGKTFVLRYGLYRPPDPLCCPTGGTADVIYTWSDADGHIVSTGQIPPTDPTAPMSRR